MTGFDYAIWQIVAIIGAYLTAAVVKGITGLGFSTTCLPILALFIGLKEALPLVIIPSVTSNLVVMRQAGHFRETVVRFWPMLLATLPGLVLGLWALSMVDSVQAGAALGGLLILWCVFSWANPELSLPERWQRPLAPFSGFVTGTVNGLTGSQVFPAVPYLMMLGLPRAQFIQAVNCSFTLSSFVMLIGLNRLGLFTGSALVMSVLGTGVIFAGLRLGAGIRDRMSAEKFRAAVLLMLIAMGVSLLALAI